jgi:hypothetical protein
MAGIGMDMSGKVGIGMDIGMDTTDIGGIGMMDRRGIEMDIPGAAVVQTRTISRARKTGSGRPTERRQAVRIDHA